MRYARLIERIVELAGLQQASEAERAVEATLPTLAEVLSEDDAEALRHALPAAAGRWLRVEATHPVAGVEAFYRTIAERSGLAVSAARVQAQAVLAAVGEIADASAVDRVAKHLPAALARLLEEPAEPLVGPSSDPTPGVLTTVAASRGAALRWAPAGR
jgi:uncharacterized protein (DUF2267 family)